MRSSQLFLFSAQLRLSWSQIGAAGAVALSKMVAANSALTLVCCILRGVDDGWITVTELLCDLSYDNRLRACWFYARCSSISVAIISTIQALRNLRWPLWPTAR